MAYRVFGTGRCKIMKWGTENLHWIANQNFIFGKEIFEISLCVRNVSWKLGPVNLVRGIVALFGPFSPTPMCHTINNYSLPTLHFVLSLTSILHIFLMGNWPNALFG